MTKPAFQNFEVECWRHQGKLGRSEPSLCLFHHRLDQGRPIADALDELEAEGQPAQRVLTFQAAHRPRNIQKLKLVLWEESDLLQVMHVSSSECAATVQMTKLGIAIVRKAVESWCSGSEDFGASPDHARLQKKDYGTLDKLSGELWFWGAGL